jgi:hypothetical protein
MALRFIGASGSYHLARLLWLRRRRRCRPLAGERGGEVGEREWDGKGEKEEEGFRTASGQISAGIGAAARVFCVPGGRTGPWAFNFCGD